MSEIRIIKALKTAAIFALIFINQTRLLAAGDSEKQVLSNRYVFQSEQSTIVQTGGIASVHYTYTVEGQFILKVDFDAHTATFEQVDANAMDDSQYKRTLDPNEVFNMTSLEGVVQDNTTIEFTGKQEGGSTIQLTVTLQDDSLHLVGNTTPPPNSADFFIFSIDALAKQKYSGGTGEPNEPYKIAEPNNWVELMNTSTDWFKNYIMTSDIDLNNVTLTPVGKYYPEVFGGIFNGNRHIIYNAEVNMPNSDYVGLFGFVYLDGQIHNLGLNNVKIIGNKNTGGLIGKSYGIVSKCYSNGAVDGNEYVGGLIGTSIGDLTQSYSFCSVNGNSSVGGLVGKSFNKFIISCYSNGSVIGNFYIGGLIGQTYFYEDTYDSIGFIDKCYSNCKVSGNLSVGGFIGGGSIYSRVLPPSIPLISDCFWDIQTSCTSNGIGNYNPDPNGIIGKTTAEMYDPNTFINASWDFIGETINGPNDIWWILEGKDYPRLWWQLPVDDFNDSKAEPLWFAYEIEPELAHLEEVNGRLEVYTTGAMEDIDAIYAPYDWGLDANKPFAAKVDFHFSKIGIGDGRMNIGIVPSMNPEAMKWAEFEVGTFDENPFFLYEIRDGFFVEEKVSERFVDDGTLYVSYDPNSDELYFSNTAYGKEKAIWTISGLIRGRWQTDSVYIILSGGSEDGMALTGQDAWLDNFKVSYGNIWQ